MNKIDAINLLPTADRLTLSQEALSKKIKIVALFTTLFFIVVSVGVFGFQIWLRTKNNKLTAEKKQLNQSISQFNPQLELQQKLRFRLKLASQLMASRSDNVKKLEDMSGLIPENINLGQINIKGNSLNVKGLADDLSQLKELENRVDQIRNQGAYQKISLGSLNKTPEGWPFTLELIKK
jgi:Tfp pilus assembly protein PilN